ncbi:MAG: hypothetical protein HY975_00505 [Candidatus Kerfeldbacteria bacterium]|nr:hypothetical protein [Candidatus Kerfeldbacteria bacterium]
MDEGHPRFEQEQQLARYGFQNWERVGENEFVVGPEGQQTKREIVERDIDGRPLNVVQEHGDKRQRIAFEYPDAESYVELDTIEASPDAAEVGKVARREHPSMPVTVGLRWNDPEIGEMSIQAPSVLETIGETVSGGADGSNEPWAHFETMDPTVLEALATVPHPEGQTWGQLNAGVGESFGGGFDIVLPNRTITIESIRRISVDFGADGRATKATFHKIHWSEKAPSEGK